MHRYEPIQPIDSEAADRSMNDADRLAERWRDLRESVGEDQVRAAVDGERWRAAVETGVIERLYEVSPGVTEAIVRGGLEADEALDLDPDVYDQIAAHQHAERLVVDAVRQGRELTTTLIRELHAAVTHAQEHYTAYDQFGRSFRRQLAHGEFKDHDNHVKLPDGSVHQYAPATQVASEMDRLVEMVAESAGDHPVRLAAFAHHRFTQIHPFADGNGRTARLLASLLLVRGGYLPLVIDRGERDAYLRALRDSDAGSLSPLLDFVVGAQRAGLLRVERAVFEPASSDLEHLSQALADYVATRPSRTGHQDLELYVVTLLLDLLSDLIPGEVERALEPFAARLFDTYWEGGDRLFVEDSGPYKERARRAGFTPAVQPRAGRFETLFRIGLLEPRPIVVGVVALGSPGGTDALLILDDTQPGAFEPTHAPPLAVSAEQPNEREIRRWVDDWLGRMLVDYAQRL